MHLLLQPYYRGQLLNCSITVDDTSLYTSTVYTVGGELEVSANFEAGTDNFVTDQFSGMQYMLLEMTESEQVVNDVVVTDSSIVELQNGVSNAIISLAGLTPSGKLADGNYYLLTARFGTTANGEQRLDAISPIIIEADFDLDGLPDSIDADDDNDGVEDALDDFPFDSTVAHLGDMDKDFDVDKLDVRLFTSAARKGAITDLRYDFNNDGKVNTRDVRGITALCTRNRCSTK